MFTLCHIIRCTLSEIQGCELACADVPAGVGDDPDGGEDVDAVDGRRLRLRHVQDDEEDEDLLEKPQKSGKQSELG